MINEINDQAGQHEVVAENLTMAIAKEIVTLVKDLKDERKRVSNVCYLFIFRFFQSLLSVLCRTHNDFRIHLCALNK